MTARDEDRVAEDTATLTRLGYAQELRRGMSAFSSFALSLSIRWYRPLAAVAILFCGLLLVIGVQPPNDKALGILVGAAVALGLGWFGGSRKRFAGPPQVGAAGVTRALGR